MTPDRNAATVMSWRYLVAIVAGLNWGEQESPELRAAREAYESSKHVWRNDGAEIARALAAGWYARSVEVDELKGEVARLNDQLAAIRQVADGAAAVGVMYELAQLRATIEVARRMAPATLAAVERHAQTAQLPPVQTRITDHYFQPHPDRPQVCGYLRSVIDSPCRWPLASHGGHISDAGLPCGCTEPARHTWYVP